MPNTARGDFSVTTLTPEITYRLVRALDLALRIPLHDKVFDETEPLIHRRRTGVGDAEVIALLGVLEDDELWRFRLTLGGGLAVPTGSTEAQPFVGSTAPTPLQLGSGTFDPLLAVSAAFSPLEHLRFAVSGGGRFALYDNSRAYRAASVIEVSGGAKWRVLPAYGALDLQLVSSHVTHVHVADDVVPNTGRHALYLAPGVEVGPFLGFTLGMTARVPAYLRVNETQFAEPFLLEARLAYRSPPLF